MTNASPATSGSAASVLSSERISEWVDGYLLAWTTNSPADIAALFSEDAEYHESPYETEWIGRDEIVEGWRSRWDWQKGGWEFEWTLESLDGNTAVITGIGHYAKLGDFDNVWTVTFDDSGLCARFVMINTERS